MLSHSHSALREISMETSSKTTVISFPSRGSCGQVVDVEPGDAAVVVVGEGDGWDGGEAEVAVPFCLRPIEVADLRPAVELFDGGEGGDRLHAVQAPAAVTAFHPAGIEIQSRSGDFPAAECS